MRAMATGGLLLEELTEADRATRNLEKDSMALVCKHVGEYGKHSTAKKAGFLKGDVLVEVDGKSNRISEGELIGHLLRSHPIGDSVNVTVLRGTERVALKLPMQ